MFDGQFFPFQPMQFMDGLLAPPPGFVGGVTSLTFVDSATAGGTTGSAGGTVTIPAGAQEGDLAVLFDSYQDTSTPIPVVPSGWTAIANAELTSGFTRVGAQISYRVLTAGQGGATVSGYIESGNEKTKIMFVFRPDAPISLVTPSTWNIEATTGNPASQNVAAAGQPSPLIVFGQAYANATTSFSTASPSFDATATADSGYGNIPIAGYKIYNSSPANHTIDMNDMGSNCLASGYIRVA